MEAFSLLAQSLVFQNSAFPNELSSLERLEAHCSHFLTGVTTLPKKKHSFSLPLTADMPVIHCCCVYREYTYISASPHRTHRLDRAPPTVYTSLRATKNTGRSAAGTFTRRAMGNHILASHNRVCIKMPY